MEMKQVQWNHVAMRTGGFSHRIIYALWLSVRIWTISLQWPCASLRGNEGLITYSTVRGQGAEKYRTSGRPLWMVEGGCNRLNGENEGGPGNFSWDVKWGILGHSPLTAGEHGHFLWQQGGQIWHISLQYRYNQTGGDVIEVDVNHKTCFMKSVCVQKETGWAKQEQDCLFFIGESEMKYGNNKSTWNSRLSNSSSYFEGMMFMWFIKWAGLHLLVYIYSNGQSNAC